MINEEQISRTNQYHKSIKKIKNTKLRHKNFLMAPKNIFRKLFYFLN